MLSRELVAALTQARCQLPGPVWHQLTLKLADSESKPDANSIQQATSGLLNRNASWILSEAFEKNTHVKWNEIAAAMSAIDYTIGENPPSTEIIWTGPSNKRFPVRRIDQVLYDLVSNANMRIVLVTFAAHRVQHLCAHLTRAVQRGVSLTLIVESEEESEGQLTRDAVEAFRDVPSEKTELYYWPLEKRDRNQSGRPGKLHIKCAIVDNVALIGSANLTDDAFNRNLELGLLVREEPIVDTIFEHFLELIRTNILVPVPPSERKRWVCR